MFSKIINLSQKIIRKAIKKGSHPVSFVLRPLAEHRMGRLIPGFVLILGIVWWSTPLSLASGVGGQAGVNLALEPEVSINTQVSVQLPVKDYVLTQRYGYLHTGYDMAVQTGTRISPIMSGRIVEVEKTWYGYGNMILVDHGNGYTSRYAHLSQIWVSVGQEVELSTTLGLVGSTGRSTGPHLHLEVMENGRLVNPKGVLGI